MRKLTEDLRIALLGATAGLFSSSVLLLIERIDTYYASLAKIENEDQFCGTNFLLELWWIGPTFLHMMLSVVASFVVHRYLTNRIRSPFLLWQTVGITTVFGWGLTLFLVAGLQCVIHGNLDPLQHLPSSTALANLAKYGSVIFACNVVYGSVINASSRQYAEQIESD